MIVLDLSLLFGDVLVCLPFCWCPCMAINVSVQYDGRFLPDIILLTQCHEPLERFIGILEPRQNNGDNSAIIPLDIRNGVILTSRRAEHPTKSPT